MKKFKGGILLITGTGGFIGKNLKEYLKDKYELLCPRSSELDLCNKNAVKEYFNNNKIDFIIHCATVGGIRGVEDKSSTVNENLAMVNNLITAKNESTRMIVFGSGAMYDWSQNLHKVKEEDIGKFVPKDLYALSKLKIWELVKNRDDILCLNIFGCYGYQTRETKFPIYAIYQALKNETIEINNDCIWDYLWIEDLCKIIEYFIHNIPEENVINLTPTQSVSLKRIAEIIRDISAKDIRINIHGKGREFTGNNHRLLKYYKQEFTPIEEGLEKLYNYYKNKSNTSKES